MPPWSPCGPAVQKPRFTSFRQWSNKRSAVEDDTNRCSIACINPGTARLQRYFGQTSPRSFVRPRSRQGQSLATCANQQPETSVQVVAVVRLDQLAEMPARICEGTGLNRLRPQSHHRTEFATQPCCLPTRTITALNSRIVLGCVELGRISRMFCVTWKNGFRPRLMGTSEEKPRKRGLGDPTSPVP
jgi:hypothetical protein